MIRYGLTCAAAHAFDGWFRSSADFDAQAARRLLTCPACGSAEVRKALMAPAVSAAKGAEPAEAGPVPAASEERADVALVDDASAKLKMMLREFRAELTKNSENVGDKFPEVARKMHAEEIERRTVHGRATAEEARALAEEGVAIHALPTFPDDLN